MRAHAMTRPMATPRVALSCAVMSLVTSCSTNVAVHLSNQSERVACAEKDNVSILFDAPEVRRFTIEARQPRYIRELSRDTRAPDWSGCDMHDDPSFPARPREVVLY